LDLPFFADLAARGKEKTTELCLSEAGFFENALHILSHFMPLGWSPDEL